jgi:hypothetical protein
MTKGPKAYVRTRKMPAIFRVAPPLELLEKIVVPYGLQNIRDTSWFTKSTIRLSEIEQLLPELEPYYTPCKAKELLHESLTFQRAITILRQVLKTQNIDLVAKEQTCGGVKGTWYQIQHKVFTVHIDFT